jgi:twitching motility two-component system response regulator PilH
LSKPSILIADDSPLVLRMIQKMLEEAGFGVVTARDGLEAIEKAVAEDVRLVIMDVMMPRMNGYQACRLLKTEPLTHHLPVVILTSRDQAGDRFWGLETGADYYITKDSESWSWSATSWPRTTSPPERARRRRGAPASTSSRA